MVVPQIVTKSVAFIVHEFSDSGGDNLEIDPLATAFYVGYPAATNPAYHSFYFVTARHVATHQSRHGGRDGFLVNHRAGGKVFIHRNVDWYYHSDENVDVAVVPVDHDPAWDMSYMEPRMFVQKDWFDKFPDGAIAVGSEVFFPSLFTPASGVDRAIPLVRFGNIAMIPDRPIQVYGGWEDVYLIEARSIGGISGAPVFIRPMVKYKVNTGSHQHNGLFYIDVHQFLGMIRGHWDIDGDVNEPNPPPGRRGVNMGIAMVVPAYRILEVLNHPELVARREEFEKSLIFDNREGGEV